jgi:hypothetical protein
MGPVCLLSVAAALLQGAALLKWFIQEQADLIVQLLQIGGPVKVSLCGAT